MTDLQGDAQFDAQFLREFLEKEKNHLKIAEELTKRFTQKYGAEFGGYIKVEYDLVNDSWIIRYGKEYSETLDKEDLFEIPERVMQQRKKKKHAQK